MAKNIQYINIIKEDTQLRIHSQLIQRDEIVSSNTQTIILPNANKITNEAIENIKSIKNKHKHTKIALLANYIHQKALPNNLWVNYEKNNAYAIDAKHRAVASKAYISKTIKEFKDIEIDYLYSAYSILYNIIPDNSCDKTLYALVVDDIIYMVMFKKNKISLMTRAVKLISYSEIEESKFYKDNNTKQTFFNQMYALELENALSSFVDDWYTATDHHQKLEKVVIACNIKQLSNEEIDNIRSNLGFTISYESIDVNQYMTALNKVPNIQSFVVKTKRSFFAKFSWSGMVDAYYHIKESNRTKGYIIACIAGVVVYRLFPDIASQITNFIGNILGISI